MQQPVHATYDARLPGVHTPPHASNSGVAMASPVGDVTTNPKSRDEDEDDPYEDEDYLDDEAALAALVAEGCGAATVAEPPPSRAPTAASPVAWAELMATRTEAMDAAEARRVLASQPTFEGRDACGLRTMRITIELEMLAKDQKELLDLMSAISDKDGDGKFLNKTARGRCMRGRMHMRALATARARYHQGPPPPPPPPAKAPVIEKGDPAFSGTRGRGRAASLWRVYETNRRIHAVRLKAHAKRVAQHDVEMAKEKTKAMSAIKYLGTHFPRRGAYAAAKAKWLARARALAGDATTTATTTALPAQLWAAEERAANEAGLAKQEQVATQRAKRERERHVEQAVADAERAEVEELQAAAERGCGTIEGWRAGVGLAVAVCQRWKRAIKAKHALPPERDARVDEVEFYDLFYPKKPTVATTTRDTAWIDEWDADAEVFADGAADAPAAAVMVVVASSSPASSRAKS